MDFIKKIQEAAASSFNEEVSKRKEQKNEKDKFWREVLSADKLIRDRMNQLGYVFFRKFFIKKYEIVFDSDDISWHMHGHMLTTSIHVVISIKKRGSQYVYTLNYINDVHDKFKLYQIHKTTLDDSLEEIDNVFLKITKCIARAKAADIDIV